ncbi:MAG: Rieske (2Fe-2S) protein, partial [Candidatus Marinimicrobia bacterium]|nr:Rieske (2Fe-2S) protein [Candidatus Neomarinimicrobiota bacterium]
MDMETVPQQSRREFLIKFGVLGALILAIIGFARNLTIFFMPRRSEAAYHKYLVGKVSEIPVGKAREIMIHEKPVFVIHLEGGFKVLSGVCTHLGCMVRWEESKNRFYYPCHKGVFDRSGQVVSGPPPTPLDEYQVELDGNLVFIQ